MRNCAKQPPAPPGSAYARHPPPASGGGIRTQPPQDEDRRAVKFLEICHANHLASLLMAVRQLRIDRQPGHSGPPRSRTPVAPPPRAQTPPLSLPTVPRPCAARRRARSPCSPPEGVGPWVRISIEKDAAMSASLDPPRS